MTYRVKSCYGALDFINRDAAYDHVAQLLSDGVRGVSIQPIKKKV